MRHKTLVLLAAALTVLGTLATVTVGGSGAAQAVADPLAKILVYGPTSGGYAETTPNTDVTVWNRTEWLAASTADFRQFDAIVFGDQPTCFSDGAGVWDAAITNRQVWSAAITGNQIINGTDPDFHGKSQFVQQSVAFAAADPAPGPGLYVSLSCVYENEGAQPVELLAGLGRFTVRGVQNCPSDAHKIAAHPTLDGLDDSYLSGWSCSAHEVFSEWPGNFQPLVMIKDAAPEPYDPVYQAPDGTTGHVYVLATGATLTCDTAHDSDGDCLTDDIEASIGTNPQNPDSDGDGLQDSWEVDPGVPGAGVRTPAGDVVTRDAAFGPFAALPWQLSFQCNGLVFGSVTDDQRRVTQHPLDCLNEAPDPLRKDVFLELDWQDCTVEHACPEVISENDDPLHHAPSITGLESAMSSFEKASVSNPDGVSGVKLHVLVDEAIPHAPNCDQDSSIARSEYFGTPAQRADGAVIDARTMGVRYVWSGHSSAAEGIASCPNPSRVDFLAQGFGISDLADYDWSPFGDANVDGRDILVTMGPAWSCSSAIGDPMLGNLGPCFRETRVTTGMYGSVIPDPGIFPAKIPVDGSDQDINWPVSRLLGETESDAISQLWARGLTHLLGHSMGLDLEFEVRNEPAPAGRHQADHDHTLTPLDPDQYVTWTGLSLAPTGVGTPITEEPPNYDELAKTDTTLSDPDNDGVLEHEDNCPAVYNPDQDNTDQGPWYAFGGVPQTLELGDACDPDIDGDDLEGSAPGFAARGAALAAAGTADPMPYDSDNDGIDNVDDPDDDNDGVADGADNCRIHANADQVDADGDDIGDFCDLDDDDDSFPSQMEELLGSDPFDAASTPEYTSDDAICSDGVDNDKDGTTDGADSGCVDGDGDSVADNDDNCPSVSNVSQVDRDQDRIGDSCQSQVRIGAATPTVLRAGASGSQLAWAGTEGGDFEVRLGDCTSGELVDSGRYDPGTADVAASAFTFVPADRLSEGDNRLVVCLQAEDRLAHDVLVLVKDTVVPETSIASGPAEGATTGADVTFEFTASEDPVQFACQVDAERIRVCDSTTHLAGLSPGPHVVTVAAIDRADNMDQTPVVRHFTVQSSGYAFTGFFAPVDNPPVTNRLNGGAGVPVKFKLGGDKGLDIFAAGSPASSVSVCGSGAVDQLETTVRAGSAGLTYDSATQTYTYVWKTQKAWAGTCRTLVLTFKDGSEARAWFQFT